MGVGDKYPSTQYSQNTLSLKVPRGQECPGQPALFWGEGAEKSLNDPTKSPPPVKRCVVALFCTGSGCTSTCASLTLTLGSLPPHPPALLHRDQPMPGWGLLPLSVQFMCPAGQGSLAPAGLFSWPWCRAATLRPSGGRLKTWTDGEPAGTSFWYCLIFTVQERRLGLTVRRILKNSVSMVQQCPLFGNTQSF